MALVASAFTNGLLLYDVVSQHREIAVLKQRLREEQDRRDTTNVHNNTNTGLTGLTSIVAYGNMNPREWYDPTYFNLASKNPQEGN